MYNNIDNQPYKLYKLIRWMNQSCLSFGIITKSLLILEKHGVSFSLAAKAFKDPKRKIYVDERHSHLEQRFFCIGQVNNRILTVRFLYCDEKIRIIGAGYWRKGGVYYDKKD